MKNKVLKMMQRSFYRSVLIMVSGTIASQLIKMMLSPIITRLYDPSAIGVMGTFMSIIQIMIPIAAFTYPMAIVLPKYDIQAKLLMKLSIYISLVTSIILAVILLIYNDWIINIFNIQELSKYLLLLPLVILFTTFMMIYEQWFIRKKQFKINASSMFYQALITEGGKVGIGFFAPTAQALVMMSTLTNGVRGLLLYLFGRNDLKRFKSEKTYSKQNLLEVAKKYRDFPLLRAPQMLIDATTQSLPILMLASFFNTASAGFFTICNTVLAIPSSLIGNAIGNVFYPRINEAALNKKNITKLLKKSIMALSAVGIFPFAIIIIFGPWLFELVFGSGWVVAGEYARWLALSRFFRFVNEPCIRVFPVLSAQSLHLKITIIQTITRLVALTSGFIIFNSDIIAISLYGVSGAMINLMIIFITLNRSKSFDGSK
ncbi:oligosaccharide flippase family protein [Oceanobacillus kimchii]|uniref:lipopolysaccharide biosynthesis protein n=1 Tax=Oceanobacillus kimchii TaxID=746691 RepID=UPI0021A50FFE|nr:oligosaccharide flippase family protein [Oceanobacillus kimchii]MCT1578434.1 oligosaccharide flippase family protein [Oceanobacillus kimchii]MCT2134612.1 oligosaccharide flippase family protein [Oceanobacillus kimchii]